MNYDINNFPLDLVLNILGIVILFIVVRFLVYKTVKKYLEARRAKPDGEKEEAERLSGEAESMKKEYENKLALSESEANAEADRIISKARQEADAILTEANERAEKVLSMAQSKIIAEREAAKKASERETINMAFEIAEKVLERRVNDSDTINLAQKFFETLDSEK